MTQPAKGEPAKPGAERSSLRRLLPAAVIGLLALAAPRPAGASDTIRSQRIGGVKAEIAALIVSGQEGGEIDLAAAALPFSSADAENPRVRLWIEAQGSSILPDESLGRIEVYAYLLTDEGSVVDSLLETVPIQGEPQASTLRARGLLFYGELSAATGSHYLRVLLREVGSGRMGARTVPVEVPDFESGTPQLLAPSAVTPADGWLSVAPADISSLAVARTARPVFPANSEGVMTVHLIGGETVATERAEVTISGSVLAAGVASREPGRGAGEELTIRFETTSLADGEHEITVHLPDAGLISPPARFLVAPIAEPTSWVELDVSPAAQAPPTPERRVAETRRQRRIRLDLATEGAAYRQVLATLSDDSLESPERESDRLLREFEGRVLSENTSNVLPDLERLEFEVAESLAKRSLTALAPIIQLHSRAYSYYYERSEFLLSTASRRTVVRLGNYYLRRIGEAPARSHGADVFASLGAGFQSRNHSRLALEMFRRAAEADPTNRAAQFGLATIHERSAAYEEAIYSFKQILEVDPGAWESRLGLALCELRIDRQNAGIRNLIQVIESTEASPWIRTIGYQELARWHIRRAQYDQAIERLDDAVAELPFDTQTRVLLAFAHDAQRQPWIARDVLRADGAAEGSIADQIGDSPRRYYAVRENSELEATNVRLRAWDAKNRPVLARLLAQTADRGSSR